MPCAYEFVMDAGGCIVATWRDSHSPEEFLAFYEEVTRHPDFRGGLNRLMDYRAVKLDLTSAQFEKMKIGVMPADSLHGKRRVAMLVADDLSFGLMRQYMVYVAAPNVEWHLTRDQAEAKDWVGLPPDYVLPADR